MGKELPFVIEVGGTIVRCADARAAADLLRELAREGGFASRSRRQSEGAASAARKVLAEGPYRSAIETLLARHPDGLFADELLAKVGFQDNPKGFGGFMTGLRKQCKLAGLSDPTVIRERRKNEGGAWKNHFRLDDKAADMLRKWMEV